MDNDKGSPPEKPSTPDEVTQPVVEAPKPPRQLHRLRRVNLWGPKIKKYVN